MRKLSNAAKNLHEWLSTGNRLGEKIERRWKDAKRPLSQLVNVVADGGLDPDKRKSDTRRIRREGKRTQKRLKKACALFLSHGTGSEVDRAVEASDALIASIDHVVDCLDGFAMLSDTAAELHDLERATQRLNGSMEDDRTRADVKEIMAVIRKLGDSVRDDGEMGGLVIARSMIEGMRRATVPVDQSESLSRLGDRIEVASKQMENADERIKTGLQEACGHGFLQWREVSLTDAVTQRVAMAVRGLSQWLGRALFVESWSAVAAGLAVTVLPMVLVLTRYGAERSMAVGPWWRALAVATVLLCCVPRLYEWLIGGRRREREHNRNTTSHLRWKTLQFIAGGGLGVAIALGTVEAAGLSEEVNGIGDINMIVSTFGCFAALLLVYYVRNVPGETRGWRGSLRCDECKEEGERARWRGCGLCDLCKGERLCVECMEALATEDYEVEGSNVGTRVVLAVGGYLMVVMVFVGDAWATIVLEADGMAWLPWFAVVTTAVLLWPVLGVDVFGSDDEGGEDA